MAQANIDLDTAIKFSFKDPEWLSKYAVAALLWLTGIGTIPALGWTLQMQHTLITTGKSELPTWDRLAEYAVLGLKYCGLFVVVQVPVFLLLALIFVPLVAAESSDDTLLLIALLVQCLALGLAFALAVVTPVLSGLLAESGSLRAALNVRKVVQLLRANWKQFLGVTVLGFVVNAVGSLAGFFLLCIGIWFTAPIALMAMHHLYGQAYRNAQARLK